ncbi:Succinate dehydrogenase subunit 5, mitochondrial [Capsicum annuum]|uniref:succinate dehydrogenase subunit 5, mitochondrial n=1 Tax=Capsicum annuum TaxID=4072 RepID=UPI001FB18BCA|nr:succinate dehydrogenase subunit 5, mitochondrial [Capsicum annuum]KAF3636466.1 Succinate dehydrogenase subunit 5, mitochondrial [Capsicum annuum]
MQKLIPVIQSLYRSVLRRSSAFAAVNYHSNRHLHLSASPTTPFPVLRHPLTMAMGSTRSFSEDVAHLPDIKDPEVQRAFKDLMAASWDELPNAVVGDAENALIKSTDDKAGQEALINVFRAAEAVEEFTGILTSLKMEIDDAIGLSGENVKPMPKEFSDAFQTIFQRYNTYLSAFGSKEGYLKKKVETELGAKMIHLKMRCSGLDSEWGKITVLGTSGLAGSYVEKRA